MMFMWKKNLSRPFCQPENWAEHNERLVRLWFRYGSVSVW